MQELAVEVVLVGVQELAALEILKVAHGQHLIDCLKFRHFLGCVQNSAKQIIVFALQFGFLELSLFMLQPSQDEIEGDVGLIRAGFFFLEVFFGYVPAVRARWNFFVFPWFADVGQRKLEEEVEVVL